MVTNGDLSQSLRVDAFVQSSYIQVKTSALSLSCGQSVCRWSSHLFPPLCCSFTLLSPREKQNLLCISPKPPQLSPFSLQWTWQSAHKHFSPQGHCSHMHKNVRAHTHKSQQSTETAPIKTNTYKKHILKLLN